MDIKELQKKQSDYDVKYWQHNDSEMEKIRHITLHIGKMLGKLSTYCEAEEHGNDHPTKQIKEEIIPDLLVYGFQLANLLGIEAGEQYIKRLEENIWRLHS